MGRPREAGDGWRGWRRRAGANVHAPHFQPAPGETQRTAQGRRRRRPCIPRAGGHPHPPHAPQRRLPSAAAAAGERLPGVPFRRGSTRARSARRRQPSPLHRAARPQAQDAGGPLAPRLPSSGRQAQPVLIPALKLNTRAAPRPPGRWRGRGGDTEMSTGPH